MVANVRVGLGSGYLGLQFKPLMACHFWIAKVLRIHWFDTAQQYERGRGEKILGAMLSQGSTNRIISKLGLSGTVPNESTDVSRWSSSYAPSKISKLLNESLQRLRVSKIHSMLLHCPTKDIDFTAHVSQMVEMKKWGLVDFNGF
jgi:aryl-alcohol dehydrogenase-like predicted oxidoreductase